MAQSFTFAHQQLVQDEQVVASQLIKINDKMTELINFFNSSAIQGAAMTDAEIQGFGNVFSQLTAAQVNGFITDLQAIQAVMNAAMLQRFSNLLCGVPQN